MQISDENLHVVRNLLDEIYGRENFIVLFTFTKKGSQSGDFVPPINEYVVWYARRRDDALSRFNALYRYRDPADADGFPYAELKTGEVLPVSAVTGLGLDSREFRLFSSNALFSQKPGPNEPIELRGQPFPSGGNSWKIATARVPMLDQVNRLLFTGNRVRYKRYADDFPAVALSNVWTDLAGSPDKRYVVQTNPRVIERCMLMTTVQEISCSIRPAVPARPPMLPSSGGDGGSPLTRAASLSQSPVSGCSPPSSSTTGSKTKTMGISGGLRQQNSSAHNTEEHRAERKSRSHLHQARTRSFDAKLAAANDALHKISDKLRHDLRAKLAH